MNRIIVLLSLITFYIYSCACDDCGGNPPSIYRNIFINDSDYFISIDAYHRGNIIKETYLIPKGTSLVQEKDFDQRNLTTDADHLITLANSVRVIFDNKKMLKFLRHESSSYESISSMLDTYYEEKRTGISTFIFTNADYIRAKSCNGNCN